MQSNKRCNAHWERNPRQYAHYPEPLFDVFTSKEALRRVLFVRNIDVRGWKLHLTDPTSESASQNTCHMTKFFVKSVKRDMWIL